MNVNYFLQYGPVTLKIITFAQPFAGIAQFETNGTYLYTRHILAVRALFNPFANSFTRPALNPGAPVSQEGVTGQPGIITHKNIKHILMQARQQLVLSLQTRVDWNYNVAEPQGQVVEVLRSPLRLPNGTVLKTDANNGPVPLHCDVVSVTGAGKSVIVDFVVQTDINECLGKDGSQSIESIPVVLAHLWEAEHDIDDQFDTTRTIRGRAVIRGDVALQRNIRPDDFRQAFFHPLPNGFKRDKVNVVATEDGNHLQYAVVDRQLPWGLLPNNGADSLMAGISHIEAVHTAEVGKASADDVIIGAGGAVVRGGSRIVGALGATGVNPLTWGAPLRAVAATAVDIGISGLHLVPKEFHFITVRVYGDKGVSRSKLRAIADGIALSRISRLGFTVTQDGTRRLRSWAGIHYSVTDSVEPKFVEITFKIKRSISESLLQSQGISVGADINLAQLAQGALASLTGGEFFRRLLALANIPMFLNRNILSHNWGVSGINDGPAGFWGEAAGGVVGGGLAGAGVGAVAAVAAPGGGYDFDTDATATSNGRALLAPPNAGQSRGSYIASCVAQVLSDPCGTPPAPLALNDPGINAVNFGNVDMSLLPSNPAQAR